MSVGRRVGELERRMRGRSQERRGDAAREYMKGLLDRYASAKRTGAVTEELEREVREAREALSRRAAGLRGGGR